MPEILPFKLNASTGATGFNEAQYLTAVRWPKGAICPGCNTSDSLTARPHESYRCNRCRLDFNARKDSVFERSHVPLEKWFLALELLRTQPQECGSTWLARRIKVTQKTAWLMLHHLQQARPLTWYKTQGSLEAVLRGLLGSQRVPGK